MRWNLYLVRCTDDSLYCGVTNDLALRLRQHNGEVAGGAKYTRARRPVRLVHQESFDTQGAALRREYQLKRMPRAKKLALVATNEPT